MFYLKLISLCQIHTKSEENIDFPSKLVVVVPWLSKVDLAYLWKKAKKYQI